LARPVRRIRALDTDHAKKASEDNVVAHHYRIGAYFYDLIVWCLQLFIGGASKWRSSFVEFAAPQPGEKIAELCCGTGSVSLRISRIIKGKVWASDLSYDQIRVATFKCKVFGGNVEFSVQDASNTPYPASFFDKVVISGALHEIRKERRLAIYGEVRRLLRNDGAFYVTEPDSPGQGWGQACFEFMFGKWNREHETVYELINNGLENELSKIGFRVENSCTSNFGVFKSRKFVLDTHAASRGQPEEV
jgi:ubiquinone/menaquinone biosynthesis C-methylase UbiE